MSKMCLFVDVYDINTDLGRWMMVKGIKGSMLKEHEKEQEGLDFQHWNPVWSFNCNMVGLSTLVPKIMTIWTMLLYFETPERVMHPFLSYHPTDITLLGTTLCGLRWWPSLISVDLSILSWTSDQHPTLLTKESELGSGLVIVSLFWVNTLW